MNNMLQWVFFVWRSYIYVIHLPMKKKIHFFINTKSKKHKYKWTFSSVFDMKE